MYDVVVIGGGPGGYVAAIRASQLDGKVALVEKHKLGGCCLNVGCIPTKALVRSAEILENVKHAEQFGTVVDSYHLDLAKAMEWKDQVVAKQTGGVAQLMKAYGIDVFNGAGSVPEPGTVTVQLTEGGSEELKAKNIIIATGSLPKMPPLSDEAISHTITSDDALELEEVPEKMLIIGGGVIAIEFACIYAAFGSEVTCIKRSPTILPPIDNELARRMVPVLRRKNITIETGIYMEDIFEENGKKVLTAKKNDEEVRFEADVIMLGMGRVPFHGGIDLDALGVEYDKWGIKVNSRMATNVPGIYAIGDVVGKTYLAPVASFEGITAIESIFGMDSEMDYTIVPGVVFSSPEAASVGLTEDECKEQGLDYAVSKFPYGANGKAAAIGETDGIVKVIADKATDKLLGLHVLGPHASDLIHEGAIALKTGATAKDIATTIHAHPTLSEIVMEAAHGIHGDIIHQAPRRRRSRK